MQDMLMNSGNSMSMLLDAFVTHRFDLMLFCIGLMGYIVLFSSRTARKTIKKVDDTFETPQVHVTYEEAETSSACFSRILDSMGRSDTDMHFAASLLEAFLEDYPEHVFTPREVQIVLRSCSISLANKGLANKLFERMESTEDSDVLSAVMGFYMHTDQAEKACDVFEYNYAIFFDLELDESMHRRLLMAALKCKRQSLAEHLLATSQTDYEKSAFAIQQWWRRKASNLGEARVAHMGDVLNRLSNLFNERHPFEEHSDDESTCFLGDDSDWEESDAEDAEWVAAY